MRAFSPFTQRALHPVEAAVVHPAAERRLDLVDPEEETPELVPVLPKGPDLVWEADEVRAVWEEEGLQPVPLKGAARLDQLPAGQQFAFEAQRPALVARGLAEAENELNAFVRAGNRVVVAFPHLGEALRQQNLLAAPTHGCSTTARRCLARRSCCSRSRPRGADSCGAIWGSSCCPTRRCSASARRASAGSADARCSRSQTCAPATTSSTRTTGSGSCSVRDEGGRGRHARLPVPRLPRGRPPVRPARAARKVSRYIGADNTVPALSKLGGKAWENLKNRARASVRELAGELLALYAQRQQAPGVAYDLRHEWLERLETEFPYRETPDQQAAIEAVKEDLEAPRPMDRLVCGDVGFGKTEVAIRAAFAVAVNGKQTLMLAPTTILAEQHWHTFRGRYRDYPVRVEMVSRFRPPREVKQVLADFQAGKVDVLIGTHRILSRDVIPKELGLVILDEEQRFGVAQKELLRALRLEVDVLTLSATPIPRTLHMSLSGLRDISIIETPPEGRRPIRTTVGEYDEELVKLALEREVEREGQAFYLHNRVDTIDDAAEKLQQLAPSLRFLVAHGQMRERELEEKMHGFLRGDADVLVSTTIIESGLDIPAGEHVIVERADQLGLSQLYQIRGASGDPT
jgi:transcription-repair coupling factor (superfamily II helicase)